MQQDMTQKKYIVPQIVVVELEGPILMSTASAESGGANTGGGSVGDDTEDLSTTRRGTWGNLWD